MFLVKLYDFKRLLLINYLLSIKCMKTTSIYKVSTIILSLLILCFLFVFAYEKGYLMRFTKEKTNTNSNFFIYKEELDSLIKIKDNQVVDRINMYLKAAMRSKDSLQIANLFFYKAVSQKQWGKQEDSTEIYYNNVFRFTNNFKDPSLVAKTKYKLGVYYLDKHNYPMSLNNFLEAEEFYTNSRSDDTMLGNVFNMLGSFYTLTGELDSGIAYHHKAFKLFNKSSDSIALAAHYANISKAYQSSGDFEKAIESLELASLLFEKKSDTIGWTNTLVDLSNTSLGLKKYDDSRKYIGKAFELAVLTKDAVSEGHILLHVGNIDRKEGKLKKALDNYLKGLELAQSSYVEQIDLYVLKNIASIYVENGEFNQAYPYMNRYYILKDSISGEGIRNKISALQNDTKIKEQKAQQEFEKQRYQNIVLVYSIVILFSLFLVFSMWLLYRNKVKSLRISRMKNNRLEEKVKTEKELLKLQSNQYKREIEAKAHLQKIESQQFEFELQSKRELEILKSKQFEMEMDAKNRELVGINLQLLSKNKMVDEIEEIVKKKTDNIESSFNELKNTIRLNRNQDEDWMQFKKVFEKIHPDFFEIITEEYPNLTKTEIRVCAYIRIKMGIDQIADLLNISHQSVITSRYRIRKKIQLKREDDLDEFIRRI